MQGLPGGTEDEGVWGTFLGDRNVLYHDYTGYAIVFFKTHSNYTLNIREIYCMWIIIQQTYLRKDFSWICDIPKASILIIKEYMNSK